MHDDITMRALQRIEDVLNRAWEFQERDLSPASVERLYRNYETLDFEGCS